MRYLIASDIHGSARWCRALLEAIAYERADRVLLLGDLLYHGPRNDLPEEYAPKQVIAMLERLNGRVLCVRGNCEAEVDQMVLPFPVLADYALLEAKGRLIFLTHGHLFGPDRLPPLQKGDIVLSGHTHVPGLWEKDGLMLMNPGSVSLPKQNSWHGYMTLEDGCFTWKALDTHTEKLTWTIPE